MTTDAPSTPPPPRRWLHPLLLLLASLALPSLAPAQLTPFVLPWDDASPGVTDLSALNRPLGADPQTRITVDADGHFRARGERLRLMGMNFAGDSPFIPTNQASAVARRLAKFGFNCVRFHHMDAPWATGGGILRYTTTSSRAIQPTQLERVHFLVTQLAAAGIYTDINLLTGREYRSGDGLGPEVTSLDPKTQHILACFNDAALALHQDFATRLLGPTNRFSGLPLAKDPAVGFVEVLNENGLLQKWYDGELDRLPAPYAGQLRDRWNSWLAARYPNHAALVQAWRAIDQPLGNNLLRNGTFASAVANWNLEQHTTARASVVRTSDFDGNPSARLTVTQVGSESWHVQFNQGSLPLSQGRWYTLTFSAKADAPASLDFSVMMAHDPWQSLGLSSSVSLSTQWQTFTRTLVASASDANARVNFGGIGRRLGTVWLADVRLQEGGAIGLLPPETSLEIRNLPTPRFGGDGFTGTRETREDWIRCLIDLENRYYDAMVGHLRTNLGYEGLIFGTIMANSPAAVQSRLDVIDAHTYWQHPQFPGTPWDPNNWTVGNVSMLGNPPANSTLAGLARQRLRGKPFTVTEYQHASPNSFSAEAPLLLAAYAALQDWDGIWLFDYGWGNDAPQGNTPNPMGRIRSFFDTAQHPTKMANAWVAAQLFRRADVAPAREEVALGLTPADELDWLLRRSSAWSVFSSSLIGFPGAHALVRRVTIDYSPSPSAPTNPPPAPAVTRSDTGELLWDTTPTRESVRWVTPKARGIVGFVAGQTVDLGGVAFRFASNALGWASAALTQVHGDSLVTGGSFVLVATGQCENTGQQWKSTARNSLAQWGSSPTLVETVPLELTLPAPPTRVRAWSLDPRGQRRSPADLRTAPNGSSLLSTRPGDATLWYEIEIDPPQSTSFEQWRRTFFDPEEIARTEVSGPNATPANDGIPNLVKYALALPPKRPVSPADLSRWGVSETPEGRRLWLSYSRLANAVDAHAEPFLSPGLPHWQPAPTTVSPEPPGREAVRAELPIPTPQEATGLLRLEVRRSGG